jgi:regulator of protease activity HflC (stomatin/prohibitin superfamily)
MKTKSMLMLMALIIVIGIILVVMMTAVTVVPAGHVGVHDLFGDVSKDEFQPGLRLKNPFAHVEMMSVKTQEYTMTYTKGEGAVHGSDVISALTKEGLTVNLDMTVLYRLRPDRANEVYKTIGPDYVNVIVRPQIRTAIRDVVAVYEAKQIYSADRQRVALEIFDEMKPVLEERGIILESVLLRHVQLPAELTNAIEQKLTAEQNIEKKAFEVQEAKQEANRKREEAQGIADANTIIANSLSNNYLRWYWINGLQTQESIYYVPVGSDGLPIMKIIDEE